MSAHRGWHSRGFLPHFDSPERVQFITFRLADSLPQYVVNALRSQDDAVSRIDKELDRGLGACWLGRPEIASLIQDAFVHFDGARYRLLAWCLMPNHAHVVIETLQGFALSDIVRSWKSFTGRQANARLNLSGPFWHKDFFDRYMRDERHLEETIAYVETTPSRQDWQRRRKNGLGARPISVMHERGWSRAVQ